MTTTNIILLQSEAYQQLLRESYLLIENLFKERQVESHEWLTNRQAMELLDVSKRTLQSYRDGGLITFSQVGSKIYYSRQDINAFLKKHSNPSFRK